MSSFYDRTYSLLEWCKETNKSQDELLRIARKRWAQAKYHFQHLKGELPPCEPHYSIRKYVQEGEDIFHFGDKFLAFLGEETIEEIYDTKAFVVLHGLFQTLHDWGHRVSTARIGSDNPYYGPKALDSDAWLRSVYGTKQPWRQP